MIHEHLVPTQCTKECCLLALNFFDEMQMQMTLRPLRKTFTLVYNGSICCKASCKIHFKCTCNLEIPFVIYIPCRLFLFIIVCTFLCGFLLEYASCTPATSPGEGSFSQSSSSFASSTNVIPASYKHKHLDDQDLISSRYQYKLECACSTNLELITKEKRTSILHIMFA